MFVVTVDFPERQMQVDFNLNIEAIELDVSTLNNLIGKLATIYYLSELNNDLYDLQLNAKSILEILFLKKIQIGNKLLEFCTVPKKLQVVIYQGQSL